MRYCINCGAQLNDNDTVCPMCGAVNKNQNSEQYANYSNQNPPVQSQSNPPAPHKNNTAIVAIIAAAIVVVAVIAAVAGVKISKNNAEARTVTVTVTQSTTAAETEKETTAEKEKTTVVQQGNVYNYYYNSDGTLAGPVNPNRYDDFDLDYYDDWDYLFPSDTELLTDDFLDSCSKYEVDLIRNEIYARHGYIFKKDKYYNYFIQKAWYNPTESSMEKVEKKFNSIEHKNIAVLVKYQNL